MFQPIPSNIKSSELTDANAAASRQSSSHALASSPHSALDGIENGRANARNDAEDDGERGGGATPRKRSHYPSESEFVDASVKVKSEPKDADVDGEPTDRMEEQNGNISDDEGQEQFDEGVAEIPTLDTYVPSEPSYEKANELPFFTICKRLEALWNLKFSRKRPSKREKLAYLLPDSLKAYLEGGSPYPFLRLVLPDHDSGRAHTGMKEARIAETWAKALGLNGTMTHYRKLVNFRDGKLVRNANSVGDLSSVVMDVVKEREPGNGSKMTVGEVNDWLDVLVDIVKGRFGMPIKECAEKSAWRKQLERAIASQSNVKKHDKYAILVGKLIRRNLSPVEHKFMVRIILQHINVGINLKDIMNYISPHAMDIHYSHNSLKELCTRLIDSEYMRLLKATKEKKTQEIMESNRHIWMTPSTLPAVIQKTISPMLSRRTSFHTFLRETSHRHSQLDKALPAESPAKSCLAMKHPAFACEIKMDGERVLAHIKRGIVTIQTRNGTWYSQLYSPAIAPSLRAAVSRYDVDAILDGEMIAWDASENKPIPFGSNRAVAEMNRTQRCRDGTLDQRDIGLHRDETEKNVMTVAKAKEFKSASGASRKLESVSKNQYWLQYVVFDILYLDGPGAKDVISKSSHLFSKGELIHTGSLINMDCLQRKSILYNLIETQDKVVEHIKSMVVRSDGSTMDAADYFLGRSSLEYGRTPCEFDSIYLALCDKSGTTKFDSQRMGGKTHEYIEIERSMALEQIYDEIVDSGGQEGLIFKDLASPYYLGAKSRSMGYWWKLKPDYDASGLASDIDLLVLGGRYATGFSRRGMVSSLIVGCLDEDSHYGGEGAKYMAVTKVNFNKEVEKTLGELTGYERLDDGSDEFQMGKWFESEDVPDYFSEISYQRGHLGDKNGWKPEKKDRPEIWIRPEDSFVVTINAGEFQPSSSFQAGFSLRFPRITKYRGKGSEDAKSHDDVVDWAQLERMFSEQEQNRQEEVSFGSQTQKKKSRFLTAKQLQKSGKQKAANSRKQATEVKHFRNLDAVMPLSKVLDGFIFSVQPGTYCLRNDAFAAAEAEEGGWAKEAKSVKSRNDVVQFIQSHGGQSQLTVHRGTDFCIGGTASDAKVSVLTQLLATTDVNGTSKKEEEARRLVEMGGVLKWTFVYAIVSKFLRRLDDDVSGYEKSIKKDCPSLARPRRSDFLAMSKKAPSILEATEDQYGLRINALASSLDFTRALEEVGRQKSTKKSHKTLPWQCHAINSISDSERWIFGGRAQRLWPYGEHADSDALICILYPDLFTDPGLEEEEDVEKENRHLAESLRWQGTMEVKRLGKVAATLPLAKALGAIVTPHLHGGVTHVLCDLKRHKMLKWSPMHPLSIYSDAESGALIHERLISLEESAGVLLVSPNWLEEQWSESKHV